MLCSWGEHFERMLAKGRFQVEGQYAKAVPWRPMVLRHSILKIATGDSGLKTCCPRATFCLSTQVPPKDACSQNRFTEHLLCKTHKLSEGSNQASRALFTHGRKDGEVG